MNRNNVITLHPQQVSPLPADHPTRKLAREVIAAYRERENRTETPQNAFKVTAVRPEGENTLLEPPTGQGSGIHLICRTAEPLEVSDGVVWEGGKRRMSTRAMLAAVLAKNEL